MSSPARIAASRANGSKSRGPKTAAGKARSARNATKHGLHSRTALTPDPDHLRQAVAACIQRFPNPDPIELALIHQIAASTTTLRRLWALERQWLNDLISAQSETTNPAASIAHAFAELADTSKFNLLQRWEGRLHRRRDAALDTLLRRRCGKLEDLKNDESNLTPAPRPQTSAAATPTPAATILKNDETNLTTPSEIQEIQPESRKSTPIDPENPTRTIPQRTHKTNHVRCRHHPQT